MVASSCGGGSSNKIGMVTPPSENIFGTYQLAGFGLEQVSTSNIIRNQDDFIPWSGSMDIDPYEIVKRLCKQGSCEIEHADYQFTVEEVILPFADGKLIYQVSGSFVSNVFYQIDCLSLVIYRYYTGYSIGSNTYGPCFEYEYWEKTSDL